MRMTKLAVISVLLLGLMVSVVTIGSAKDLLDTIKDHGYIICGTTLAAPPFAYRDVAGSPAGFEIDLMNLLGKYMGVEVQIEDMAWAGLIPALLSGRIDVIASRMSATMERATKVTFSQHWLYTGTYAFALDSAGFTTWQEANKPGVKVGAIAGAVGETIARAKMSEATLITYELDGDEMKALTDGRIDVALNDELIGLMWTQGNEEIVMLEGNLQPDVYAYAVRPEDMHLVRWLDLWFDTIMRTGEYAEIYEKWLGKPWEPNWGLHP